MIYKINTSKQTMDIFEKIKHSIHLNSSALSKIAISLSIKSGIPLTKEDFQTDTSGIELDRQAITEEWDLLYICLIKIFENRNIGDEECFAKYIKAHLDRGAKLLNTEFRYNKDLLLALLDNKDSL